MITKEQRAQIIKEAAINEYDTGSTQVQIALLSARIENLSKHLQTFKKDKHSHRGLMKMICQRRALQKYLDRKSS
ncbi:MAG: 30S ribosomal protein S15 [Candidatus Dependentiae bacterium]|jgi:small subunit ribosomal protein S15